MSPISYSGRKTQNTLQIPQRTQGFSSFPVKRIGGGQRPAMLLLSGPNPASGGGDDRCQLVGLEGVNRNRGVRHLEHFKRERFEA